MLYTEIYKASSNPLAHPSSPLPVPPTHSSPPPRSAAEVYDDLHSFDPSLGVWTRLSPAAGSAQPPPGRFYHGFASEGGKLYVHGGGSGVSGERSDLRRDFSARLCMPMNGLGGFDARHPPSPDLPCCLGPSESEPVLEINTPRVLFRLAARCGHGLTSAAGKLSRTTVTAKVMLMGQLATSSQCCGSVLRVRPDSEPVLGVRTGTWSHPAHPPRPQTHAKDPLPSKAWSTYARRLLFPVGAFASL
jgi:hypothetical protein